MIYPKITGLVAAPFTPFCSNGELNLKKIELQAQHLIDQGVSGAFVCGTTGEGFSLTIEERVKITEQWINIAKKDLKIVVHVGHPCLQESKELAKHAQQMGAHAFSATPTSCFKSPTVQDLVEYAAEIAASAPKLPFYYYHIPFFSGVAFKISEFLEIAESKIPNLAGIKFTNEDLMDYGLSLQFQKKKFDLLFGRDEILLGGLAFGAEGAVGSTYNFMAPLYLRMIEAWKSGALEEAQRLQYTAQKIIAVGLCHGGLPAFKEILKIVGIDLGPVRKPLRAFPPQTTKVLEEQLEKVGFFKYATHGLHKREILVSQK